MNEYVKPIILKQQQAEIALKKNAKTIDEIKSLMETEFNVTFDE